MSDFKRPLPVVDEDSHDFWTAGGAGELRICRCQACGYYVHPPVRFCPDCDSRDVKPEVVSGRGTVVTFTVNHKQWVPDLAVPYVLALVGIDEQPAVQLPTNIIGCAPEDVRIGMPVEVTFEQSEDVWIPLFRPREG